MKKRNYLILILLLLLSNVCISQKEIVTAKEQKNINLFNDFKNYLVSSVHKKEDIGDNAHLKYVALNYVFINKKLDSTNQMAISDNELSSDQVKSLKEELNAFFNFLQEDEKNHLVENITLTPIRLGKDTFIYNRLTKFQKENTFILFDKRFPNKILGYVLFIPPIRNKVAESRIWSWALLFKFGKYVFKSVTGEEGYEYIFSPR
jgi:hypothetical protein